MMQTIIKGKHNEAKVFTDNIEEEAVEQIKEVCNQDFFKDSKIRIMPDVHKGSGCTIGTTMTIRDKIVPNLVGVDIGCLDRETEYLTEYGWKRICDYKQGERILQYDKNNDIASFVKPINYIVKDCDEFYHFKNNKGLDQMLSEEHKMLIWKGYKSKGYQLQDMNPIDLMELGGKLDKGYYGIKTAFKINNKGVSNFTNDEIRLDIMLSADGCNRGENNGLNVFDLHLKKDRKIKRARDILKKCNIAYKEVKYQDGSLNFNFLVNKKFNKDLSKYFVANYNQLKIVAEESLLWDGHKGYRSFYASTDKTNSDAIQFAFSSTGVRASISVVEYENKNWKKSYIVTPTKNNVIGVTNTVNKVKSEDGKKYCFTVPTGYFIARRNGKIFITGNCGVIVVELGFLDSNKDKLKELDDYIRGNIPHGFDSNTVVQADFINEIEKLKCYSKLRGDSETFNLAIGSLGSGNHYIEVNEDSYGMLYLTIHSGSRNLGHQVASYYQNLAFSHHNGLKDDFKEVQLELVNKLKSENRHSEISDAIKNLQTKNTKTTDIPKDLQYLEGTDMDDYLHDMKIVQEYANLNRITMTKRIVKEYLGLDYSELDVFQTIHNYIDLDNMILRKGAISAQEGEKVIIPINMRDGSILAYGEGNPDWNYSAPHGAGRILSRTQAKEKVNLKDFEKSMEGIFTTSVNEKTIDESPMAYKNIDEIIKNTTDAIGIIDVLKPIYNFKSN